MRRPPNGRIDLAPGVASPIHNSGTGRVRDECFLEWTVEHDVATTYHWQGAACGLAAQEVGASER